jgi:hypothetical protein
MADQQQTQAGLQKPNPWSTADVGAVCRWAYGYVGPSSCARRRHDFVTRLVPVEQLLKTSRLRTVPVYLILGAGGLGLGTLLGSLSGVVAALRFIGRDDDLTRWLNDSIQRARVDSVEHDRTMVDQPTSEL